MHQIKSHTKHDHSHSHTNEDMKNIGVAFFLNLTFTFIEIIGGILTNSLAIISDAVHDFGDSISLGLAWYFQKVSKKGSNAVYSYGYKRFSILGALINAVILSVGSVLIFIETIPRLFHPQTVNAEGMIWLAVLGILVNGAAALRLNKGKSLNEKVVSLHMLEDVLGWIAVLIGSILMYYFNWSFIDPLLSIGISIFILVHVFSNIKATMKIILQGVPENIDLVQIRNLLMEENEIKDVHDLHIWTIDGEEHILSVHIVLNSALDFETLSSVKEKLRLRLLENDIEHATFEFELKDENCSYINCCK